LIVSLLLGAAAGGAAILGVLLGAALVTALVRARARAAVMPALLSFAAGTLLAAALLGLLPEAAEYLPLPAATGTVLLAIVAFLLLEKWILWRHAHESRLHNGGRGFDGERGCAPTPPAGYLILVGDSVHNLIDGVLLGAALAADPRLGLIAGVAVVAHEVPQELGDYVLLLESGLSRRRALAYNLLSALAIVPGVVAGHALVHEPAAPLGAALAFAAGGFLYVALADLVPELHRQEHGWQPVLRRQFAPLLAGIATIWAAGRLGH
jgi:zinc and cadmium transporter